MHPHLISQLIAGRQADLMASAQQQRAARQARAARRTRPAQRSHAARVLAVLGRLAWRRSPARTIQTPAAGPEPPLRAVLEIAPLVSLSAQNGPSRCERSQAHRSEASAHAE